jgi:hypothetical protein
MRSFSLEIPKLIPQCVIVLVRQSYGMPIEAEPQKTSAVHVLTICKRTGMVQMS